MRHHMKFIIFSLLTAFCSLSFSEYMSREDAYEVDLAQIQYSDISKTGTIRVKSCSGCTNKLFNFDDNLTININSKISTIDLLLQNYSDAVMAVIFTELNSNKITRISLIVNKGDLK